MFQSMDSTGWVPGTVQWRWSLLILESVGRWSRSLTKMRCSLNRILIHGLRPNVVGDFLILLGGRLMIFVAVGWRSTSLLSRMFYFLLPCLERQWMTCIHICYVGYSCTDSILHLSRPLLFVWRQDGYHRITGFNPDPLLKIDNLVTGAYWTFLIVRAIYQAFSRH